jgi:hypothetical protein
MLRLILALSQSSTTRICTHQGDKSLGRFPNGAVVDRHFTRELYDHAAGRVPKWMLNLEAGATSTVSVEDHSEDARATGSPAIVGGDRRRTIS